MTIPSKCPVCATVLEFPQVHQSNPVRCPVCNSRFMIDGNRIAHLKFTDFYKLLEVSPQASDDELRKAIRTKIMENHPDRNPDDPDANDRMREILQAKEILSDPQSRETYDSVYFARQLSIWTGKSREGQSAYSAGVGIRSNPRSNYEEMVDRASSRSQKATYQDIDHLISEIDSILSGSGISKSGIGMIVADEVRRYRRGMIGGIVGFALGIIIGFSSSNIIGFIILLLLTTIAGWFVGSYAGEMASVIFLAIRFLLAGYIVTHLSVQIAGAQSYKEFARIGFALNIAGIAGGVIFAIVRLGASAMGERIRIFVGYKAIRQAAYGAWITAFLMALIIFFSPASNPALHQTIKWWFVCYTVYLIIDAQIFGRPWIFVR